MMNLAGPVCARTSLGKSELGSTVIWNGPGLSEASENLSVWEVMEMTDGELSDAQFEKPVLERPENSRNTRKVQKFAHEPCGR